MGAAVAEMPDIKLDPKSASLLKDYLNERDRLNEVTWRKAAGLDRPEKTLPGSGGGQAGAEKLFSVARLLKAVKNMPKEALYKEYGAFEGDAIVPAPIRAMIQPETWKYFPINMAPEHRAKMMESMASQIAVKAGLFESSGVEGGALIPQQFIAQLQMIPLELFDVANYCNRIPVGSPVVNIPRINDTTHATNVFGGIQVYWQQEGVALNQVQPAFGTVSLTSKKLTGFTEVTNELLADSAISVDTLLTSLFRQAMAWFLNKAIIRGSGVGEPLGLLNALDSNSVGPVLSVAKETNQVAATLVYANIVKMWSRLYPMWRPRSIWLANPDVQPQLQQLALTVGVAGSAAYLPANGLAGQPFETLFGRPILYTEHCSTIGTQGDIILGDFTQYLIGDRQQMTMAVSEHYAFNTDQTAFRLTQRLDGKPWMTAALTPANGTSKLTSFVVLDARS